MNDSPWSDASTWEGDGLRREVFFFRSGGVELYASLFAAAELSRPFGVVACGSWGVEADRTDPLLRSVALSAARLGGAALVFHYPGYGDSFGDLASLSLADLGQAACDAAREAFRRRPGLSWILAGFMLGASVACLAERDLELGRLLLVQPAPRPGAYFRRLAKNSKPLAPGPAPKEMMTAGTTPGMVYGYPIPRAIIGQPAEADADVEAALADFTGIGAAIRQEEAGRIDQLPASFAEIAVDGRWRFGSQNHPELSRAAIEWLDRSTHGGAYDALRTEG